ncbi:divergent PAP2 family protein [Paenibacillus puerhi]|uniref:divergent PAP2 family protein n=1 Tax=Paenibacillus puerhi TaxID=2692622 RepID=UPI001356C4EB|nr:divergent PAP2 family protein [Paenibacillus puerhi]
MNRALGTSLIGIGLAQVLKMATRPRGSDAWKWPDLTATGGMPSSHAAGVVSLAAYLGLKHGFSSDSFAVASLLGLIVMYDAMGIRHQAGLIASEVNGLEKTVVNLTKDDPAHQHPKRDKLLEERLGHLPVEVLCGALLGAVVGWASYAAEPPVSKLRALF